MHNLNSPRNHRTLLSFFTTVVNKLNSPGGKATLLRLFRLGRLSRAPAQPVVLQGCRVSTWSNVPSFHQKSMVVVQ